MPARKHRRGFTLLELIIVGCILSTIVLYLGFYCTLAKGNFWVSKSSALDAVKFVDPTVTQVDKLDRNIWWSSRVYVTDAAGQHKVFLLDANILQDVDATLDTP